MSFTRLARRFEAALLLAALSASMRVLPFRYLPRLAGIDAARHRDAGTKDAGTKDAGPNERMTALAVGRAVAWTARHLPWKAGCLAQALAGAAMLRRRAVPCRVEIGVAKGTDGLAAHAWLTAGGTAVCGGAEAPGFTPIAAFAPAPARR